MKRLWIATKSINKMIVYAERKFPLETGGVLVGYFSSDNTEAVITGVTGPGPGAKHQKYSYTPDYEEDKKIVGEIFDRNGGVVYYLGDWHTHPNCIGNLSLLDKKTLRNIANNHSSQLNSSVMVILGKEKDAWDPMAWCARKCYLKCFINRWQYVPVDICFF